MTIGFIGAGSMVGAIARGAIAAGWDGQQFLFTDAHGVHARQLADQLGAQATSAQEIAKQADMIVLGVKPYQLDEVVAVLAPVVAARLADGDQVTLVSIAAGRSIMSIQQAFAVACHFEGDTVPVIRVMPNVNASIGQSMTALCPSAQVLPSAHQQATELFEAVGHTTQISEKDFSVFSALAGCSPAWVYRIIDALATAGVKYGLPKAQAVQIVASALQGSASLVLDDASAIPAALIDRVLSPGGTTVAGLLAAEESGLSVSLTHAVDAAVARDRELG